VTWLFLLEGQDFDSITPSLQRQAVLKLAYGLYEVVPGHIYQALRRRARRGGAQRAQYDPGEHPLPVGKGHVAAIVRIQVYNPNDPMEIALVNSWQDKPAVHANSAEPFVPGQWDEASLDAVRAELEGGSWSQCSAPSGLLPRRSVPRTS